MVILSHDLNKIESMYFITRLFSISFFNVVLGLQYFFTIRKYNILTSVFFYFRNEALWIT